MDSDDLSYSDEDHDDSDRELQVAFQKGLLKPGLNVEVEQKEKAINDVKGLQQALKDLKNGLPWIERLDLTVTPLAPPKPLKEQLGDDPDNLEGDAMHDDFKREMRFHRQAQAAVLEGLAKLKKLAIPTKRPDDYFAEMAKTDRHMKKVREKLLAKQVSMERSEKAKKLRELRKYGKQIQQEVLQKRQKEKKEMLDAMKKYRKGKDSKLDFLDESKLERSEQNKKGKDGFKPNQKRQNKNKKFGFGGQKKRSKHNTAKSANDMSGFSVRTHGAGSKKKKDPKMTNKNKNQRPGKRRRQKMNSKKR